eukprot:7664341-Ditylum_brightwellii.AAC.1
MKLNINFFYASKQHKKGFSFYILKYMHKSFDKYTKQLADNGRFLRNWSVKKEMHVAGEVEPLPWLMQAFPCQI